MKLTQQQIERLFDQMKDEHTLWFWKTEWMNDAMLLTSIARDKKKRHRGNVCFYFPTQCESCGQKDVVCFCLGSAHICIECLRNLANDAAVLLKKDKLTVLLRCGKPVKTAQPVPTWLMSGNNKEG